jgi:hypothetical protein
MGRCLEQLNHSLPIAELEVSSRNIVVVLPAIWLYLCPKDGHTSQN